MSPARSKKTARKVLRGIGVVVACIIYSSLFLLWMQRNLNRRVRAHLHVQVAKLARLRLGSQRREGGAGRGRVDANKQHWRFEMRKGAVPPLLFSLVESTKLTGA